MVRDLLAIRRDPLGYLERTVQRFGDLVAFPLPRTPVLLVNEPDGVRRVLVENPRGYSKATVQYTALSAVTGVGLLTADGDTWRQRRRIAQPAFHHGSLDVVAAQSVLAGQRIRRGWRGLPDGTAVDVDAACMAATLDVVGGTLFAADLAQDGERIVRAVQQALEVVVQRARLPRPAWLPVPSRRRLDRAVATLDETCARVVRARRARGITDDDTDLLALLLRSADAEGGLTDQQVRDELVTLVIAGHETVASSLAWTLQLLAEHPQVQDTVQLELAEVLAGREPGWADLAALPYTRRVVDEALRLYPPAWVLTRRALQPDVLAGVEVPAGTLVIISPWLLHRRSAAWERPLEFDPDRFAAARSSAPRPDYLPFGMGPRLCIGRDFALVESVLVLATLLPGLRLEPARRDGVVRRPDVDALVTLRPRGGLPLVLRRCAG
ncbi:cytochrome P450 [Angustibacter sp. McL0619]|uniref:cytochrome P450 n=1 Tax=Angustibacter sp. McL0619 TaxID=3415676 RepID=UPI003CE7EF67